MSHLEELVKKMPRKADNTKLAGTLAPLAAATSGAKPVAKSAKPAEPRFKPGDHPEGVRQHKLHLVKARLLVQLVESQARSGNRCKNLETLKSDRAVVLVAVRDYGLHLLHVAPELRGDRDIVLAAIGRDAQVFIHASPELRNSREFMLAAVRINGMCLEFMGLTAGRSDFDVVLAAVDQNGLALGCANLTLRSNPDIVFAAVSSDGISLGFARGEVPNDRRIVTAAVQNTWIALQYASEDLRRDPNIIRAAAAQDPTALTMCVGGAELWDTYKKTLAAVTRESCKLLCLDPDMPGYRHLALAAVSGDAADLTYPHLPEELREDREIALAAVLASLDLGAVPDEFQVEPEFVAAT